MSLHYSDPSTGPVIKTQQTADGEYLQVTAQQEYTTAYEWDANGRPVYIGYAYPGNGVKSDPVWKIVKLAYDTNGNLTDRQYAGGSTQHDQVWNNRRTLSYA